MSSHLEKLKEAIAVALFKRDLYAKVFSGPNGERVLSDILLHAGVGADAWAPGDPSGTQYNVGRQAVGARIIQILNMSEADVRRRILDQQASIEDNREDINYD